MNLLNYTLPLRVGSGPYYANVRLGPKCTPAAEDKNSTFSTECTGQKLRAAAEKKNSVH